MKTLKFVSILCLTLALFSCNDDDETSPSGLNDSGNVLSYFPITAGNSWTYENRPTDNTLLSTFTQQVTSEMIDSLGNTYHRINAFTDESDTNSSLFLARVDDDDRTIFLSARTEFDTDSQEFITIPIESPSYLTSDNIGLSFETLSSASETMNFRIVTVLEENNISLDVNEFQFENVIRVRTNVFISAVDDPINSESLFSTSDIFYAPNVGVVRSIFFDSSGIITSQRDITAFEIQ